MGSRATATSTSPSAGPADRFPQGTWAGRASIGHPGQQRGRVRRHARPGDTGGVRPALGGQREGPYFIVQRAPPLPRDGGRIVSISCAATRIARPETGYAMSKGALDVLGRNLANGLGPRGITALGRVGQPEDVADAVAFLVSDDARRITRHWLDATGGLHLGPGGFRARAGHAVPRRPFPERDGSSSPGFDGLHRLELRQI
ncbi:SDR family oxidoreductase [Streptomyces panacea]|uniref:SDR family oxidoreductase n=1 Tax=Streptomyces panacea TaxID=3035064 RepID=UPI00339BFE3F